MAENHYVDAKDQHIAAEGVADHSDLTTFYAEAKKEELGPWMQEADRQKVLEEERNQVIRGLRKSAFAVGIHISLTAVIGLATYQLLSMLISPSNAILILFFIIIGLGGYGLVAYAFLKWVWAEFHKHNLRALPITLTTIVGIIFISRPVLALTETLIGGLIGYGVGLATLVAAGTIITTAAIFAWTSHRVHGLVKIAILGLFIGIATAITYLA